MLSRQLLLQPRLKPNTNRAGWGDASGLGGGGECGRFGGVARGFGRLSPLRVGALSAAGVAAHAAGGCAGGGAHAAGGCAGGAHASPAAVTAAHHRCGDLGYLLAVHDDRAAVQLARRVEVEGELGVDLHVAAVDGKAAVRVERIGVALCHVDGDVAAVDLECGVVDVRLDGGVDAIVGRVDADDAVVDLDVAALDALFGLDGEGSAVDLHERVALDAIACGLQVERAAGDVNVALRLVFVVHGVDAVGFGVDGERAFSDGNRVVALDAVAGGRDLIGAARDLQPGQALAVHKGNRIDDIVTVQMLCV